MSKKSFRGSDHTPFGDSYVMKKDWVSFQKITSLLKEFFFLNSVNKAILWI